jgi:hypothetical protein
VPEGVTFPVEQAWPETRPVPASSAQVGEAAPAVVEYADPDPVPGALTVKEPMLPLCDSDVEPE